jgi:hypothetical protein
MGLEFQERDGYEGVRRQGTFESSTDTDLPMRFIHGPPSARGMDTPPQTTSRGMMPEENLGFDKANSGPVRLLALPEDRISLSETLCLVREVSL